MRVELVLAIPATLLALFTVIIWVLACRRAASEREIVSDRIESFANRKE